MGQSHPKFIDRLENLLRKTTREFVKIPANRRLRTETLLAHHAQNFDNFAHEVFAGDERFDCRRLGALLGGLCAMPEMLMTEDTQGRVVALRGNIQKTLQEIQLRDEGRPVALQDKQLKAHLMAVHQLTTFRLAIMKIADRLGCTMTSDLQEWEYAIHHQPKNIRTHWKRLCKRLESPLIELEETPQPAEYLS